MRYFRVILAIFVLIIFSSCENYRFAKAVQEETERTFKERKSLFYSISFKGVIKSKDECINCEVNRFVVNFSLLESDERIDFTNKDYLPYYKFGKEVLTLSVGQKAFEKMSIQDTIIKLSDSRFIMLSSNEELEILNEKSKHWLAN